MQRCDSSLLISPISSRRSCARKWKSARRSWTKNGKRNALRRASRRPRHRISKVSRVALRAVKRRARVKVIDLREAKVIGPEADKASKVTEARAAILIAKPSTAEARVVMASKVIEARAAISIARRGVI